MLKKILIGIGSILMLVAPFKTIVIHNGRYLYNLFDKNGFGIFGPIIYGAIIIGILFIVLSLFPKKRWLSVAASVIGIIPIALVIACLIICRLNAEQDVVTGWFYTIIVGGIILWVSIFLKNNKKIAQNGAQG